MENLLFLDVPILKHIRVLEIKLDVTEVLYHVPYALKFKEVGFTAPQINSRQNGKLQTLTKLCQKLDG